MVLFVWAWGFEWAGLIGVYLYAGFIGVLLFISGWNLLDFSFVWLVI